MDTPNPFHICEGLLNKTRVPQNMFEQSLWNIYHDPKGKIDAHVQRAYDLHSDNFSHMVNAALHSYQATLSEIADCFGVEAEVIDAYANLFFDMRELRGVDRQHRYAAFLSRDYPGIASLFEDVKQFGLGRIRFLMEPGYCKDNEQQVYDELAHGAISRLRAYDLKRLTSPYLKLSKELLADRKFVTDWVKHKQKQAESEMGSGGIEQLRILLRDSATIHPKDALDALDTVESITDEQT